MGFGYHNTYSAEDEALLCQLYDEGHGSKLIAAILGRSQGSVVSKANRLGRKFKRFKRGSYRHLHINLDELNYRHIAQIAAELEIPVGRVARIAITILNQRQLWGALFRFSPQHPGPTNFDGP